MRHIITYFSIDLTFRNNLHISMQKIEEDNLCTKTTNLAHLTLHKKIIMSYHKYKIIILTDEKNDVTQNTTTNIKL